MPRKPDYLSWINNDTAQIEWANSYLSQRGFDRPIAQDPENHQLTLSSFIEGRLNRGPEGIYFVQTMRSAWKQKELRDNRKGQKAYNFVLRAEIKARLDTLSKTLSAPRNEVVEAAILSYDKSKKELARMKKKASHLKKSKLEKELAHQVHRNRELENRHNEWQQQEQELQSEINKLRQSQKAYEQLKEKHCRIEKELSATETEITNLKDQIDRLTTKNLELMQAQ